MNCVISLDHIFRNNLADSMKEAILLYKQWEFQGVLISQMQHITNTLRNIEHNTASMCENMNQMIELQYNQAKTLDQILHETECTRYATEAVKSSTDKMEWYAYQKRLKS